MGQCFGPLTNASSPRVRHVLDFQLFTFMAVEGLRIVVGSNSVILIFFDGASHSEDATKKRLQRLH